MKNIVQFTIQKGEKYYTAHANDFPIFTQAETLDKLMENIQEATTLHFLDEDFSKNDLNKKPSVFVNFDIPQYA